MSSRVWMRFCQFYYMHVWQSSRSVLKFPVFMHAGQSSRRSRVVPVESPGCPSVIRNACSFGSPAGRRSFRINHLLMQGPVGACTVWPARRRSRQRLYLVVAIAAKRPARNACGKEAGTELEQKPPPSRPSLAINQLNLQYHQTILPCL
eukprot:COSAG02_NODE_18042_length_964_cov_1.731792_1_plen_148_part_01